MSHKISVLMPVYNGEKHLKEAIESILSQTFSDFEFLIIDDGSTDQSTDIISSYEDPRIELVKNQVNLGIEKSLNKGINLSKGEYIIRMDCDDISHLQRISRQLNFMETHTEIAVCGSWVNTIGDNRRTEVWQYPTDHNKIDCSLLFSSALAHPSVIIRKGILEKLNLFYSYDFKRSEDYELWVRLCENGQRLANLQEVLLDYRISPGKNPVQQIDSSRMIRARQLSQLGLTPTESEQDIHESIARYDFIPTETFLTSAEAWLKKIYFTNHEVGRYSIDDLADVVAIKWLEIVQLSAKLGIFSWRKYTKSNTLFKEINASNRTTFISEFKFLLKCFMESGL